jgi:hypothetical protein
MPQGKEERTLCRGAGSYGAGPQLSTAAAPRGPSRLPSGTMRALLPQAEHGRQARRCMHGGVSSPTTRRRARAVTTLATPLPVMVGRPPPSSAPRSWTGQRTTQAGAAATRWHCMAARSRSPVWQPSDVSPPPEPNSTRSSARMQPQPRMACMLHCAGHRLHSGHTAAMRACGRACSGAPARQQAQQLPAWLARPSPALQSRSRRRAAACASAGAGGAAARPPRTAATASCYSSTPGCSSRRSPGTAPSAPGRSSRLRAGGACQHGDQPMACDLVSDVDTACSTWRDQPFRGLFAQRWYQLEEGHSALKPAQSSLSAGASSEICAADTGAVFCARGRPRARARRAPIHCR